MSIRASAVMILSVRGEWKWGEHKLTKVSSYGIELACNRTWDVHLKRVFDKGKISCTRTLSVTGISI